MKRFLYYCPECRKVTLMTLLKEDKKTNTVFLKCIACSASESRRSSDNKVEKSDLKDRVKEYSPKESYSVGDSLYHKTFDDTGEVIKITKRFNGQEINTVLFPNVGLKKLITLGKKKV